MAVLRHLYAIFPPLPAHQQWIFSFLLHLYFSEPQIVYLRITDTLVRSFMLSALGLDIRVRVFLT